MQFYTPLDQEDFFSPITALLLRTTGDAGIDVTSVRQAAQSVASDLPFAEVHPLEELVDPQYRPWRTGTVLLSLFAALAVCLSAIGLAGIVAYAVSHRKRELGVRTALGAGAGDLTWAVVNHAIGITGVGLAVGTIAVVLTRHILTTLVYGTSAVSPAVLVPTAAVLMGAAALGAYIPARAALKLDPASVLRDT